jgi:endoribonuclease Dicer
VSARLTRRSPAPRLRSGVAAGLGLSSSFASTPRASRASKAPETVVTTYSDYYAIRWRLTDLEQAQPLLRARRATAAALRGAASAPIGDAAAPGDEEEVHLVPQLCGVAPAHPALRAGAAAALRALWQLEGDVAARELLQDLERPEVAGAAASEGAAAAVGAADPDWRAPPLALLRRALTARSALDAAGDYEALENLGDAFIKYAVSAQLFLRHPLHHEGQLAAAKDRLVSNRALLRVALRLGLDRRVRLAPARGGAGEGGDSRVSAA